jgi:hypothetical protein
LFFGLRKNVFVSDEDDDKDEEDKEDKEDKETVLSAVLLWMKPFL